MMMMGRSKGEKKHSHIRTGVPNGEQLPGQILITLSQVENQNQNIVIVRDLNYTNRYLRRQ